MHLRHSIILILILVFAIPLGIPSTKASSSGGGGYAHPEPQGLKPGDIVLGYSPSSWWIPGYWSHAGMIIGWSSEDDDWLIVESRPEGGVQINTLKNFMSRYPDVAVLRVSTNDQVRQAAVAFALQQVGKSYDYAIWFKHIYGDTYYCSELVWAAYMAAGGPDIDEHPGFSWRYLWGVAPQEIYDDSYTYVIYRSQV